MEFDLLMGSRMDSLMAGGVRSYDSQRLESLRVEFVPLISNGDGR